MGHAGEGEAMICPGWYEDDSGTRRYNFRIIYTRIVTELENKMDGEWVNGLWWHVRVKI